MRRAKGRRSWLRWVCLMVAGGLLTIGAVECWVLRLQVEGIVLLLRTRDPEAARALVKSLFTEGVGYWNRGDRTSAEHKWATAGQIAEANRGRYESAGYQAGLMRHAL